MTVPVIHSLLQQYPEVTITILTGKRLQPLFGNIPANIIVVDTKGEHKGVRGIFRFCAQLYARYRFDAIADLHHVLRSGIIRLYFGLKGVPAKVIDKARQDKKKLTRKSRKELTQLPSSFQRYQNVFRELGFEFALRFTSLFTVQSAWQLHWLNGLPKPSLPIVGIAPFAAFPEKTWPPEKMEEVIRYFSATAIVVLFGGPSDRSQLEEWQQRFTNTYSVAGKMELSEELQLMTHLNVMISMDSANMHFASLVNVPVVSIWGPTHPYAGFMGWHQPDANAVQIDLPCRPCSVFGNKTCYRGDHACMNELSAAAVIQKVESLLLLAR